jgi:ParB/RepB/Spo0J family partition protein
MIVNVPIDKIESNPWNTRQGDPDEEYIEALANDILQNGLLQAPAGRLMNSDGSPTILSPPYNQARVDDLLTIGEWIVQLAFGHNRLEAFKVLALQDAGEDNKIGYDLIPVDLQSYSDEQMALLAWSENEKRRDVTPIERAKAIQRRIDDFGWSLTQIAEKLGISRPAVSNSLRLLKLPDEVQAALSTGAIPERTAVALVSLYDLPDSIRKSAERYWPKFSEVVRDALKGGKTSDEIRQYFKQLLDGHGRKLEGASFGLDQVFTIEGVHSPTCRDCDQRLKESNICLGLDCFKLKSNAGKIEYLQQAGQVCGILPIENLDTLSYDVTSFTAWRRKSSDLQTVREAKCPNLRLMYDNDQHDNVDGFPNAFIVCGKKEQFCTCLKGLEYAAENPPHEHFTEGPTYSAYELKELARAKKRDKREAQSEAKDLLKEAAERIATGLAMKNRDTWRTMLKNIDYGLGDESLDMWEIQVKIGMKLADRGMPYEIESVAGVISGLNRILAECGLEKIELPKVDLPTSEDAVPAGRPLSEVFAESES